MSGYKGVECQSLEKDDDDEFVFIDNRENKFIDDRYNCLCQSCRRICDYRNTDYKNMCVKKCDCFVKNVFLSPYRLIKYRNGEMRYGD